RLRLRRRLGDRAGLDLTDDVADLHGRANGDFLLAHRAGDRARQLHGDLVGLELCDRLVDRDRLTDLLEPTRDDSLGDRLAELWNDQVRHEADATSTRPFASRRRAGRPGRS